MDGTIIKTEHIWDHVTQETLDHYGIIMEADAFTLFRKDLAGMSSESSATVIQRKFDIQDSIKNIAAKQNTIANRLLASSTEYIEGFEEFHQKIVAAKMPHALATNTDLAPLEAIRKAINLDHKFGSNIYSIAHVNFKAKPDPAVFLHAAQKLGIEPEMCIVFEDTIHGFNAAKAAGMRCIAISNERNQHVLSYATNTINNYYEAEEALRTI